MTEQVHFSSIVVTADPARLDVVEPAISANPVAEIAVRFPDVAARLWVLVENGTGDPQEAPLLPGALPTDEFFGVQLWVDSEEELDTLREASKPYLAAYESELKAAGHGKITTEIAPLDMFYYAEDYHQQYLAKNPAGYCGIGGTGVACPVGLDLGQKSA